MSLIKSKFISLLLLFSIVVIFASCAKSEKPVSNPADTIVNEVIETPGSEPLETPGNGIETPGSEVVETPKNDAETPEDGAETSGNEAIETSANEVIEVPGNKVENPAANPVLVPPVPQETQKTGKLIVIDAGHQAKGNSNKEKNSPSSSTMKAKVSSGTKGVSTGLYEYDLNLQVTIKLQAELERRGYKVLLVRDSHQVDISNVERAQIANNAGADAFIRIHANGSDDQSVHGALTICQTSKNQDNANTYKDSYALSDNILKKMVEATGAKDRGIWQTDTMTGINWSKVPSTIVEMGFMSNPEEDKLLATESYQDKIVQGISNGIDAYFSK